MAACGESVQSPYNNDDAVSEEVISPTESETKISRSPSSSSYDHWPTLLVSKKPPSFYKKLKRKLRKYRLEIPSLIIGLAIGSLLLLH